MADADPLRARRHEGQEDLGGRGVRVLVEAVMLDLPDAVVAELVGEDRLLEAVAEGLSLGDASRVGDLHPEEDRELHGPAPPDPIQRPMRRAAAPPTPREVACARNPETMPLTIMPARASPSVRILPVSWAEVMSACLRGGGRGRKLGLERDRGGRRAGDSGPTPRCPPSIAMSKSPPLARGGAGGRARSCRAARRSRQGSSRRRPQEDLDAAVDSLRDLRGEALDHVGRRCTGHFGFQPRPRGALFPPTSPCTRR